jgi:hypothetical protein
MRKLRRRRTAQLRSGTYRGFYWERESNAFLGEYFTISDHAGKCLGGTSDYKRFIERWQAKNEKKE